MLAKDKARCQRQRLSTHIQEGLRTYSCGIHSCTVNYYLGDEKLKKIVATVIMGSSLLTTSIALAAPDDIKLTGETSVKYVREKQDNNSSQSGMVYTFKLMVEAPLTDKLSAYTRIGGQITRENQVGADFNSEFYPDKKSVIELDQYGLIFKNDKQTYKIGRQDATVGATALLYSRSDSNIGKKNFVDGISMSGTVGSTDISALFAREDNVTDDNNRVYAIRAGYKPSENWNVGVTLGRFQNSDAAGTDTNHWALDGTYKFGKSSLTAEYTQSNISNDNKAVALVWNYDADNKTTFSVTGFRVEANGDMGGQSDFGSNNRGIHYSVKHLLADNTAVEFVYKDEKSISDRIKASQYEATLSYTF